MAVQQGISEQDNPQRLSLGEGVKPQANGGRKIPTLTAYQVKVNKQSLHVLKESGNQGDRNYFNRVAPIGKSY